MFLLISRILAVLSLFCFILCMWFPLKKSAWGRRHPSLSCVLGSHTLWGILLLLLSLIHGILAIGRPGMMSGKLAWTLLLFLILLTLLRKKLSSEAWRILHRITAILFALLLLLHIFCALTGLF